MEFRTDLEVLVAKNVVPARNRTSAFQSLASHLSYIQEWVMNMSSLVLPLQKGPIVLVPDER